MSKFNTHSEIMELHQQVAAHDAPHKLTSRIKEVLLGYVDNNCLHPRKLVYTDKVTNEVRQILVPCGRCRYCQNRRIGEWSSRMSLHTDYSAKHCYFITLTYGSFNNYDEIPVVLRDAYYRLDTYNYRKRLCYSPCLLRHEHVQRFMKYLRKLHGDDYISFFQGSEYGSDFGRPHHHLILWSNEPISYDDVRLAWSCRHKINGRAVTCLIGRIDFNDLNANGTIVADGINFGHDRKACFNYVAKYCAKSFIDPNNKIDAKSRLNLFISDLANNYIKPDIVNAVITKRIKKMADLFRSWAEYAANYIKERDYQAVKQSFDPYVSFLYNIYYDYEISQPFEFIINQDEALSQTEQGSLVSSFYQTSCPLIVFRKIFRSYCNASRRVGIGGEYLSRHIEEFAQGKFNLPKSGSCTLVTPSYFIRKTKEYLYRYAFVHVPIIGKSSATALLVNDDVFKAAFPQTSDLRFLGGVDAPVPQTDLFCYAPIEQKVSTYSEMTSHRVCPDATITPIDIQKFLKTDYAFNDYVTHCRCLAFVGLDGTMYVSSFQYNRRTKLYDFVCHTPFLDFAIDLRQRCRKYLSFLYPRYKFSATSLADYDMLCKDISEFVDSCLDTDFNTLLLDAYDTNVSKALDIAKRKKDLQIKLDYEKF